MSRRDRAQGVTPPAWIFLDMTADMRQRVVPVSDVLLRGILGDDQHKLAWRGRRGPFQRMANIIAKHGADAPEKLDVVAVRFVMDAANWMIWVRSEDFAAVKDGETWPLWAPEMSADALREAG